MTALSVWLREIGERATPARWAQDSDVPETLYDAQGEELLTASTDGTNGYIGTPEDAHLIVTARNLWEQMVAVVEAAPKVRILLEDLKYFESSKEFRNALDALAEVARREGWTG